MSKRVVAIITAGFLTLFAAFAIRYSYGLILPYMLSELRISKAEAGVIFSSYFIAATMLSPVIGLLIDRFDARIILSVFVAILGAGAWLMSLSSSVGQASIFFAIAGIGHSACWVPVVAVDEDIFDALTGQISTSPPLHRITKFLVRITDLCMGDGSPDKSSTQEGQGTGAYPGEVHGGEVLDNGVFILLPFGNDLGMVLSFPVPRHPYGDLSDPFHAEGPLIAAVTVVG